MRLCAGPQPRALIRILEDATEQPVAAFGHERFDAGGDPRRRILIVVKVFLKVPADAFVVRRCKLE